MAPQRGCLLATQVRDATRLPPQDGWAGDTGQGHGERGVCVRTAPSLLAASLTTPERRMALLMVMTGCWLV